MYIYFIRPFKNIHICPRKPDTVKSLKLREINNTKEERSVN